MNATFSLTLVIFVTFIVPVPMGITVVSVTITMVLPLTLSPFPRYYHKFVPITAVLPRIYRCPHPHAALYLHSFTRGSKPTFQQICPTLTFILYSLDCLHDNRTGLDLSCSSVYF